jgi:hypothetical protein
MRAAIVSLLSWVRGIFQRDPRLPQGLSPTQFAWLVREVRARAGHLTEDTRVHGSRARADARPDSDLDIALLVSVDRFEEVLEQRFGKPNPGSAKERTMQHAREVGKIQGGELGLRALRRDIEEELGLDVDISLIRIEGPFDKGPYIRL